jgi:hypothetical protein
MVRSDDEGPRWPQYATAAAACAVGCWECGARLDALRVLKTGRPSGRGSHAVACRCGAVTVFDVVRRAAREVTR